MNPVIPIPQNWKDLLEDADYLESVTPAASIAILLALNQRITNAAIQPYAGTGLANHFTGEVKLAQQVINIGTKALFGLVARSADAAREQPNSTSLYSGQSGATSIDEILIDSPFSDGNDYFPATNRRMVSKAANNYDESPTGPTNRLFEASSVLTTPYNETFEVTEAVGFTTTPVLVSDLRDLE